MSVYGSIFLNDPVSLPLVPSLPSLPHAHSSNRTTETITQEAAPPSSWSTLDVGWPFDSDLNWRFSGGCVASLLRNHSDSAIADWTTASDARATSDFEFSGLQRERERDSALNLLVFPLTFEEAPLSLYGLSLEGRRERNAKN